MRTKLAILLLGIFLAVPSQAQIPHAQWWVYDGSSLYPIITVPVDLDSVYIEHIVAGTSMELPYPLLADGILELIDAYPNVCYWSGSITHDSLTAVAVSEDVRIIQNFPAKYKILEIFVDVTEVWDDAAGPISACVLSVGWTAAPYDDLMQTEDIYTAVTQLGDAAAEINYTAVQGGIRASWSAATDIYLRFTATGANLATLTTGELTVYVTYSVY